MAVAPTSRTMLLSLRFAPPGHPELVYHSFIAGAIGGYFIWGRYSAVNQQIVLYLASRVLMGLWNRAMIGRSKPRLEEGSVALAEDTKLMRQSAQSSKSYPIMAAIIWGVVMALWEENPDVLQLSLKKSMDEIYRHDSFRPGRQDQGVSGAPMTRLI